MAVAIHSRVYDTKFQKEKARLLALRFEKRRPLVFGNLPVSVDVEQANHAVRLLFARRARGEFFKRDAHVRGVETPVGVGVHVLERDGLAELTPAPSTQVTHDENLERDAVRGKRGAGHGPGFDAETLGETNAHLLKRGNPIRAVK